MPRYAEVCMPAARPLSDGDPCLVVDGRDLSADEDIHPAARSAGLTTALGARQIVAVLENLHMQTARPSMLDKVEALNYFLASGGAYIQR
jgi:hypothetical protein